MPTNEIEVLDYSDLLQPKPDPAPEILRGKFLLVENNCAVTMLVGLVDEFPYHAALLSRYCDDNSIPCAWIKRPDVLETYDRVVDAIGGGWLLADPAARKLELFGSSSAYGPYDASLIRRLLTEQSALSGWQITLL